MVLPSKQKTVLAKSQERHILSLERQKQEVILNLPTLNLYSYNLYIEYDILRTASKIKLLPLIT